MFSVRRGDIYHIRGDTGVLLFQPTDETGKAVTDFQATLSVKQDINADDYLLQKICVDGKFDFRPEDTDSLSAGTYVYDIEVHTGSGQILWCGVLQLSVIRPRQNSAVRHVWRIRDALRSLRPFDAALDIRLQPLRRAATQTSRHIGRASFTREICSQYAHSCHPFTGLVTSGIK